MRSELSNCERPSPWVALLVDQVPIVLMEEWFSHRPIPELADEKVSNPQITGITDQLATVERQ